MSHNFRENKIIRFFLMMDRPLFQRMLVIFTVIVIVPLITVGAISYIHSSNELQEEAKEYNSLIIEQVKTYIEDYIWDYEISTLKIVNHPDTIEFLRMNSHEEIEESGITQSIINVLRNEAYSQSDIANITLVVDDISIVDSAGIADESTAASLRQTPWYYSITGMARPTIISRVIDWHGKERSVISVVKRIVNPHTLQPFGMLIIDLNYQRVNDVARKISPGNTGYFFITDQEGHYIYHPNSQKIGEEYNEKHWQEIEDKQSGSYVSSDKNPDLITYSESEQLGWTLATTIPYHEVTQGIEYIKKIILKTIVISLIIVIVIGYSFSSNLLRPIRRLKDSVSWVDEENFSLRVPVESKDEIGQLTEGFNNMMDRISSLVQEVYIAQIKEAELQLLQKDTELKALQSQMDPHFLYNSLETIRGMALESNRDDIATISASMGKLLRYNLKEQSKVVDIKNEIEMSMLYLKIQKYRFNEKIEYQINMPEWCWRQKVARFSLQPLIENAVIHGAEPSTAPIVIEVTAEKDSENTFVLLIKDTGVGMTKGDKKLRRIDLKQKDVSNGGSHIGMVNVHRRNQLVFGEEFGLVIKKSDKSGTTIGICLPYEEME
ncbi:sensor histidine kinase [Salipaludibacillus sp. CF4.18]|uniref:sensor histidine kinase n=1 Tax=Salipaludibacillus sp. CF4.18 TaxID=3373081 RepID=UPI003EE468E5